MYQSIINTRDEFQVKVSCSHKIESMKKMKHWLQVIFGLIHIKNMLLCLFTDRCEKYLKLLILNSKPDHITTFSNEHESRIRISAPLTVHYTHISIIISPCDLVTHLGWNELISHNRRFDPQNEVGKSLESYDDGNDNYSWQWQKTLRFCPSIIILRIR